MPTDDLAKSGGKNKIRKQNNKIAGLQFAHFFPIKAVVIKELMEINVCVGFFDLW